MKKWRKKQGCTRDRKKGTKDEIEMEVQREVEMERDKGKARDRRERQTDREVLSAAV